MPRDTSGHGESDDWAEFYLPVQAPVPHSPSDLPIPLCLLYVASTALHLLLRLEPFALSLPLAPC